ncbi:amino acid/amide ABC transporter substrate-binding protein, HAAT family [Limimonas halophila]|uniref:Amino acid/amide ABC transporter substrate-binding protein, HAAT family n=1 Tax=Limimonas halophila TaxID=1082479 RepID=A0A1G7TCA8_9PROT|nr:substrate-binding protein [Limimonas halophila]SDG32674.1 amino acid/amide ABC transporter substrate-binding protein, HAAT family [Limimonas halophila]
MTSDDNTNGSAWSRRRILKAGAAGTAGLGAILANGKMPYHFVRGAFAEEAIGNFPIKGKTAVFGFNVPQTGAYADEGKDELRAYKLAVKHLNEGGGMLETMQPTALSGNGVLGKKIDFVTGDTQTDPDAARQSARRMIERDGVIMYSGGSSSAVAIAQQSLAQQMGVIFMSGLTHSNDTTGKDRRRYGFRHFFNAYMSGQALGPILSEQYGEDRKAFHLTADYTWGHTQYESIKNATEGQGWKTVNNIMTPLGTSDYSQFLTAVLNSDADVLVLNHYGGDMVNSITQAVRFGMKGKSVGGKEMQIVVPLYSRLMAQGAGAENIEGVLGSQNWNWKLDDAGSNAFKKAFEAEYGQPPSQAAHTAYVQTLLYADAVERAETFYPPAVIKALEDHEFDGMGNGKTTYRACDHQCFKDMLVVQGKAPSEAESEFDLLKIVSQVPEKQVSYACDFFSGELGDYKPA